MNQLNDLSRKPEVVVATPGRLLDHMRQGKVNLKNLDCLVLDEVDRMLDMGFLPDVRRIVGEMSQETADTAVFGHRAGRDPSSGELGAVSSRKG